LLLTGIEIPPQASKPISGHTHVFLIEHTRNGHRHWPETTAIIGDDCHLCHPNGVTLGALACITHAWNACGRHCRPSPTLPPPNLPPARLCPLGDALRVSVTFWAVLIWCEHRGAVL